MSGNPSRMLSSEPRWTNRMQDHNNMLTGWDISIHTLSVECVHEWMRGCVREKTTHTTHTHTYRYKDIAQCINTYRTASTFSWRPLVPDHSPAPSPGMSSVVRPGVHLYWDINPMAASCRLSNRKASSMYIRDECEAAERGLHTLPYISQVVMAFKCHTELDSCISASPTSLPPYGEP